MSNPKPFPLSQFDTLNDGQPIAAIQGRIVKLFDQKTGTSSAGPWAIQNGEIEADGVVLPIMFKDRDRLDQTMKGRTILLTSSNAKSMAGIYRFDDTRNDVTVVKIKVTASATLDLVEMSAPSHQEEPSETHGKTSLQNPPPRDGVKHTAPTQDVDPLIEAKKTIVQIMNLHLLCAKAVEKLEAPAFKIATGHDMPESQRQGAIASVFIESCRSGLVRQMPTKLVKDPEMAD